MKWLLLPLLWLLALGLALAVLWRMWRGKNIVLRGRFAPSLVRRAVIILVMLGIGIEKSDAAPADPTSTTDSRAGAKREELPASLTQAAVGKWLSLQYAQGPWSRFKQQVVRIEQKLDQKQEQKPELATWEMSALESLAERCPARFRALIATDFSARSSGKPAPQVSAAEILAALCEMEEAGYWDPFLIAYLFRRSSVSFGEGAWPRPQAEPYIQLYARLHQHARVVNALVRAQARVKPLMQVPRPWMSKAYDPNRENRQATFSPTAVAEVLGACKALYADSNSGTWERDGAALFTLGKQPSRVSILRPGGPLLMGAGQPLRMSRLELIETPASPQVVLQSAWLGELPLPAGRVISVWALPRYLNQDARAKLEQTLAEALSGQEAAAERLELHLPLVQEQLRAALRRQPQEKGAPRLRLILSLFDDAVMPPLTFPTAPQTAADALE